MQQQMVAELLEGVPLPLVLVGGERVLAANRPARRLLGADIIGRHHVMAMRQPSLLAAIEGALGAGRPGQGRHVVTGPSRETAYRVTVTPVLSGAALCAFEDLSGEEQAGAIRRDFVANVSHELRTPLTALLGFIETLRGAARDDPAARERFLVIMAREAGRMNRLVQDLLSLSRVEAEERVRPTGRVDLDSVLAQVLAALRPVAEAAGVTVERSGLPGPLVLPGDADQLSQVFHNLIENAIKYGGAGGLVTVAVRQEDAGTRRGGTLQVDVIDRGEGIDPLHLPRLTERFYRIDDHRSREKGGTGLGLAIVKHIVNRHRGRMSIDSAPGKGSRFSVILPVAET